MTEEKSTAVATVSRPETITDILLDQGRALTELRARFPQDLTDPGAAQQFLALCLSYDLDPFHAEMVPFKGRPYIAEAGWLKLINKHAPGQLVGDLSARLCSDHEKAVLGLGAGDFLAECTVQRKWPSGETLSTTRRATVREKEIKDGGFRPVDNEPWEMAEKRARTRALKTAFRDVLELVPPQFPIGEREDAFEGEPVAVTRAIEPDEVIEANATAAEKDARGGFYAKATDLGLTKQADIHRLLELPCKSGALHDVGPKDPNGCHALRAYIDGWVAAGETEDAVWEKARILLGSNYEKRLALGNPDGTPAADQAGMFPGQTE